MRPAKIQISLRIRAVWSESSLDAFWTAKEAKFFTRTVKTLTRLRKCAGWSGSSLGAHARRYHEARWKLIYIQVAVRLSQLFLPSFWKKIYSKRKELASMKSKLFLVRTSRYPFSRRFVCWKANRKSQDLCSLYKMADEYKCSYPGKATIMKPSPPEAIQKGDMRNKHCQDTTAQLQ